ncbi:hypothetical protein SEA_ARACELI_14 [Streptomyces phage Araceli]|nr:hypothetical protein SEA_HENOCCUS_14 [Streptomyces phage Henoccus]QFG07828.1 hypothetical protein SEA_ARACELI_14 [Streptomyces phage Araceli]
MGDVLLTPKDEGNAIELSRTLFRKKILPKGVIDYKGRKIVFDDEYLTDLAQAYKDGAYDQVPYMLADASNAHTMDPERYRGEIKGVEVAEDGLYGTFELSADAAELVRQNPKLGVSARIVEGYARADGKVYPRAMQHVLGTLDPRIPGLGAWQEVALSGYDSQDEVLDLTAAEFEGDEDVAKDDSGDLIDGLTREEYEALLASLDLDDDDLTEDDGNEDEGDENDESGNDNAGRVPAGAGASLSNDGGNAIELANTEIRTLKVQLAADRFNADKREYVRKGVPPALVELARPVLEAPDGFVLDFSNTGGAKVDAADVVRKLLDSAVGYIDLAKERGHAVDFSNEGNDEADEDAELLKLWAKQSGETTD